MKVFGANRFGMVPGPWARPVGAPRASAQGKPVGALGQPATTTPLSA